MDRTFDIDDLGQMQYFDAEDVEYNEFLGKKFKNFQKRKKELKQDYPNASNKEIRQMAMEDTGYGLGLKKLIEKGKTAVEDLAKDAPDEAVDGTVNRPVLNTETGGAGNQGGSGGSGGSGGAGGAGGALGGKTNIAGMDIPTPVLLGLGAVAAYFAYKKFA